jgi:hypothetical protein
MENEKNNYCCQNLSIYKILGTVLTIFVVVFLSVLTWNEIKKHDYIGRESQQTYTISIDGEGKINAVPDIAQISLGLQTEKLSVVEAQKENTDKMNQIIKEIKAMGIEDKDIATENYSIYPRYDWIDGRQVLKGYQINQNVTVKIRDLSKIGSVVDQAGKLGANQVGSLSFTIDEPEKLRQQAREKALANAKEKAEALAKIAGVKLGKLVSFTEGANGSMPVAYRDYAIEAKTSLGMGGGAVTPDIQPGSQDIIINVMVTYEVL